MPEAQLSIGAKVAKNLVTYFAASLLTFACALLGSLVTHLVVCVSVVALLSIGLALIFIGDREKKEIVATTNVVLFGFGLLGSSLEFETTLGQVAEPLAYFSIGLLLIGILVVVYMIFSPLWKRAQ